MTDSWAVPKTMTLLMYGSSLTSGRLNGRLDASLQERLQQQPEARGRVVVISAGRGSQTSTWGVDNIGRLAALKATHALVEPFDINNAVVTGVTPAVSRAQATTDRATMRAALLAANPDIEVIWWTGNPVDSAGQSLRPNLADYYNDAVAQAAAWGDVCVDAYNGTVEFPGGWPKPLTTSLTYDNDGLHPTPAASAVYLLPQLVLALRKRMAVYWGLAAPSTPTFNALTLSASTIAENSPAGTVVGTLQGTLPDYAPTLSNDAGGRFAIASNGSGGWNLVAGLVSTDYETATSHNVTVRQVGGDVVNSPRDTVLTVTVTDVAVEGILADVLLVGGGAAGGHSIGGGGGGGQVKSLTGVAIPFGTSTGNVGQGGASAASFSGTSDPGGDTTFLGQTARGGGPAGHFTSNGGTRATGGGGGQGATGGPGTSGEGQAGGNISGGGGGSSGPGAASTNSPGRVSGNGGAGTASSITGSSQLYGGGGPGGLNYNDYPTGQYGTYGSPASAGRGTGGRGGSENEDGSHNQGQSGYAGCAIVSFTDRAFTATGTFTSNLVSGKRILVFTSATFGLTINP
jgi:hypothetical protein